MVLTEIIARSPSSICGNAIAGCPPGRAASACSGSHGRCTNPHRRPGATVAAWWHSRKKTWLHRNAPALSDTSAATPAARDASAIAATGRLAG